MALSALSSLEDPHADSLVATAPAPATAPSSKPMTSGAAIVESLISHGVDTVFGLPGVQTYALFEALRKRQDRIRYVGARHEQGAAYMAFGYAKATGRPGVYSVVPGPGFLNTTAALSSAYAANAPVLCLTGEVPTPHIGLGGGQLHELPDQLATIRLLTKWATRVRSPSEVPQIMNHAFLEMMSGRRRPVAVETPWDVLLAADDVALTAPLPPLRTPELDEQAIDTAVQLIRSARKPMIMVGGGAMEAGAEVLELAQRLQAPVVSFRSGRGVLSDDLVNTFNCAQGLRWWNGTDLLIGVGSRLELQFQRWPSRPRDLKMIRIDVDARELARLPGDANILTDARVGVARINDALRKVGHDARSRTGELAEVKREVDRAVEEVQPQLAYLRAIREVLPRDGYFVEELSQVGFASYFGFPVYEPRTFVSGGYMGNLGFGFPTALGVKVAQPKRAVVSVTGDGGFMFGMQELASAVQNRIALVTVLFNNNAYGNVLRDQTQRFSAPFGATLVNPDFVKLGESFGALSMRATSPVELRRALERAFACDGPSLVEVTVPQGSEVSPWKFIMPGGY